jgi:hypothetical protein
VAILQQYCEDKVSDAQFKAAQEKFKHINPPQSKVCTHMCRHHCTRTTLRFSRAAFCAVRPQEEAYYRLVFDAHYPGQEKFVNVWEGGCRAAGVSRAFPSCTRSIWTEIYLCHACSCHEIEDGNARAGRVGERGVHAGGACGRVTAVTRASGQSPQSRLNSRHNSISMTVNTQYTLN